jgi:hypothetical protein
MIKSDLITAVNTQLTAIITQAKVRLASLQLVNEVYPTTQVETELIDVITTASADFDYNLNFTKIGRLVHVTGTIRNVSGSILGFGANVFEFKATEFYPNTTITQVVNTNDLNFTINASGELQSISPIGLGQIVYLNFNYSTQD